MEQKFDIKQEFKRLLKDYSVVLVIIVKMRLVVILNLLHVLIKVKQAQQVEQQAEHNQHNL